MKKNVIAGVASFALATAPAAVTFAVSCTGSSGGQLVDNIGLTVNASCSFTRASGGAGATPTKTIAWNALDTSLTNTFTLICNDAAGYKVTGTFSDITSSGKTTIAYSTTTPTAGSGTWTATKGAASATTNMTSGTAGNLMSATTGTSASGVSQQVTYKIGTGAQQERGSYTGTATYVAVSNT